MTTHSMEVQPVQMWELEFTFGDRIRKARRVLGLTVEQMATALGVTKQVVSQWETGVSNPRSTHAIARRLEFVYGIPAWWLLGNSEPPADVDGGPAEVRRQGLEPRTRYLRDPRSGMPVIQPAEQAPVDELDDTQLADLVAFPVWRATPGAARAEALR